MRATTKIAEILERFVSGFNTNSLDEVMEFFSDDAVYRPGDGSEFRGHAAIREAFRPQFSGAHGTLLFLVDDSIVDEAAGKAAIRWVCQHDFTRTRSLLRRLFYQSFYGRSAGWYGTDIFHFDDQRKIVGKFSYANYHMPHLRRDLGTRP